MAEDSIGDVNELEAQISSKISQLYQSQSRDSYDIASILYDLKDPVSTVGLGEEDLDHLQDLVFDIGTSAVLTPADKRFTVRHLFLPRKDYFLNTKLIYRILSHIGIPQVIYKKGAAAAPKSLSINLQLQLLQWLVCSLHLFGEELFPSLHRMLPILFKHLSYEYSRPYIANLIFLTISSCSSSFETHFNGIQNHRIHAWKRWHIQLVVDLFQKFPLDEYLKSLLVLFKTLDPSIDWSEFSSDRGYDLNRLIGVTSKVFTYPNFDYLDQLKEMQYRGDASNSNTHNTILQDNLRKYENFGQSIGRRKRQKYNSNSESVSLDTIEYGNSHNISINEVHSLETLVLNLNNIRYVNMRSLFNEKSNARVYLGEMKKVFFILSNLSEGNINNSLQKIDYYIRLSIIDDNISSIELNELCSRVRQILQISVGTLEFNSVNDFILFKFDAQPIGSADNSDNINYVNLIQRSKLLSFLPLSKVDLFEKSFFEKAMKILDRSIESNSIASLRIHTLYVVVPELMSLYRKWYSKVKSLGVFQESKFAVFEVFNSTIPRLFKFILDVFPSVKGGIDGLLLPIMDFIRCIEIEDLNEFFDDSALLLPPALLYSTMFQGSPLLSSELCGYIAFCKNYHFKKEHYHAIQRTYVMDVVNLVWRDNSFHYERSPTSPSKAFQLNPYFISNMRTSHIFNFSNLASLNTTGNLFISPAWSFITAQLIWKFEDSVEEVATRHSGPVSKESVFRMNADNDLNWLPLTFDELKLKVLRELDSLGFKGLCDLLFNSLKTLQGLREEQA
ncbi:uncharacterized protein RJT20DRAFT_125620 [Scheffersomyces xylosifermentans]|uniref:uncharacterized protein n=1 Tax=Scheffersomyces xylosifermentans TaxID=1304137 RepID=UPI00315DDA45